MSFVTPVFFLAVPSGLAAIPRLSDSLGGNYQLLEPMPQNGRDFFIPHLIHHRL